MSAESSLNRFVREMERFLADHGYERAGGRVRLVESSPENLKVTTPLDLQIAEALLVRDHDPERPPS